MTASLTKNGEITAAAAMKRLTQIADEVRNELFLEGLIREDEDTPAICVLERITHESPVVMSRLMADLRNQTFVVAVSRPITVKWERRPYTFGPIPVAVSFPLAHQVVKKVKNDNQALFGYGNSPYTGAAQTDHNEQLIVISWKGWATQREDGSQALLNDTQAILRHDHYLRLEKRERSKRHYDQRYRQAIPSDPADAFKAKPIMTPQAPPHQPALPQYTQQAPEGVKYPEVSGSATTDFDPRRAPTTQPAGALAAALKPPSQRVGSPPPMAEVPPAIPNPPNAPQAQSTPPVVPPLAAAPQETQPSPTPQNDVPAPSGAPTPTPDAPANAGTPDVSGGNAPAPTGNDAPPSNVPPKLPQG